MIGGSSLPPGNTSYLSLTSIHHVPRRFLSRAYYKKRNTIRLDMLSYHTVLDKWNRREKPFMATYQESYIYCTYKDYPFPGCPSLESIDTTLPPPRYTSDIPQRETSNYILSKDTRMLLNSLVTTDEPRRLFGIALNFVVMCCIYVQCNKWYRVMPTKKGHLK